MANDHTQMIMETYVRGIERPTDDNLFVRSPLIEVSLKLGFHENYVKQKIPGSGKSTCHRLERELATVQPSSHMENMLLTSYVSTYVMEGTLADDFTCA